MERGNDMALDRVALINGLSAEFDKAKGYDIKIDQSNFIDSTNSLDCTAAGIPLENLNKTRNVLMKQRESFKAMASTDPMAAQNVLHLENALKCVEQVISEKARE